MNEETRKLWVVREAQAARYHGGRVLCCRCGGPTKYDAELWYADLARLMVCEACSPGEGDNMAHVYAQVRANAGTVAAARWAGMRDGSW
jgi:hypothetical protein